MMTTRREKAPEAATNEAFLEFVKHLSKGSHYESNTGYDKKKTRQGENSAHFP